MEEPKPLPLPSQLAKTRTKREEAVGEIPVQIEVVVSAEEAFLDSKKGRELAVEVVETAILDFITTLNTTPNSTEGWITEKYLSEEQHQAMFPYLRWPGTSLVFEAVVQPHFLLNKFDLQRSLVGQRAEGLSITVGQLKIVSNTLVPDPGWPTSVDLGTPLFEREIASLVLNSLEFEEGSIAGKSDLLLKGLVGALITFLSTVLASEMPTVAANVAKERATLMAARDAARNTPCEIRAKFEVSGQNLRKEGGHLFDYKTPYLSSLEIAQRTCWGQLALALATGKHLAIDGKWGPETEELFRNWTRRNGLDPNIESAVVQVKLLKDAFPGILRSGWFYVIPLPAK